MTIKEELKTVIKNVDNNTLTKANIELSNIVDKIVSEMFLSLESTDKDTTELANFNIDQIIHENSYYFMKPKTNDFGVFILDNYLYSYIHNSDVVDSHIRKRKMTTHTLNTPDLRSACHNSNGYSIVEQLVDDAIRGLIDTNTVIVKGEDTKGELLENIFLMHATVEVADEHKIYKKVSHNDSRTVQWTILVSKIPTLELPHEFDNKNHKLDMFQICIYGVEMMPRVDIEGALNV